VVSGEGHKLVQDPAFLLAACLKIPGSPLYLSGASVPPLSFGNLHYEESMTPSVTVSLRQVADLTFAADVCTIVCKRLPTKGGERRNVILILGKKKLQEICESEQGGGRCVSY